MPQFAPKTVPAPSFGNELATRQARARAWFQSLRNRIVDIFESLEAEAPSALYRGRPGKFELTPWSRAAGDDGAECGGGVMGMMRGRLFEKVGVHISTVHGVLPEDFAKQVKGAGETRAFWASGVSLIAHTKNPRVPAVHMNTRMIATTECWFGGGADLNPTVDAQRTSMHPDAQDFHAKLKNACDRFDASFYPRFSKWAEEYFWLPHRGEPRGVGGIFYDHLDDGDWERNFAFTQSVGTTFCDAYSAIILRHLGEGWSDAELDQQAKWRSRYVEFNLLYDRGTTFGLKTGGNVESILSSMPPSARWP